MTAFEKWQLVNMTFQSALLTGTFVAAFYIGRKQTEISARQTEISQRLLDLGYGVSVPITYDLPNKRFVFKNNGRHNIYLAGGRANPIGKLLLTPPPLISVGDSDYIEADVVQGAPSQRQPYRGH